MREKRNRTLLPLGRIGFWLSSPPAGEAEKYLTHMRENKIRSLLPRGVLQGSLLSDPPTRFFVLVNTIRHKATACSIDDPPVSVAAVAFLYLYTPRLGRRGNP